MTRVLLLLNQEDALTGYRIEGHTGFAPQGEDIVCAALSFLSITCANALEAVSGQNPQCTERDGYLEVLLPHPNEQSEVILKTFELGVKDLQAGYPKHITMNYSQMRV